MNWFRNSEAKPSKQTQVTELEERLGAAFYQQYDYLSWLALIITGDSLASPNCVMKARLSLETKSIGQHWMSRSARIATVREAVWLVCPAIQKSARFYSEWRCEHIQHAVLSSEETLLLLTMEPKWVIEGLGALPRTMLVLRGVLRLSTIECAIASGVPSGAATGAFCEALEWCRQRFPSLPYLPGEQDSVRSLRSGTARSYKNKVM